MKILYKILVLSSLFISANAQGPGASGHTGGGLCGTNGGSSGGSEDRNVLGLPGPTSSSEDWVYHLNVLEQQENYKINQLFSLNLWDFDGDANANEAAAETMVGSNEEVLALGHDVGGLIARKIHATNPNVNGAVLVGTPLRGSMMYRNLSFVQNGENSEIYQTIEGIGDWLGDNDCPTCNKRKKILELLDEIQGEPMMSAAIAEDPFSYHNQIPDHSLDNTAILWGNAGNQTLIDLLDSKGLLDPSFSQDLKKCAEEQRKIREAYIEDQKTSFLISSISTIYKIVSDAIKVVKGEVTKAADIVKTISDVVKNFRDLIEKNDKLSKEEKELLLCDLADRQLEAVWRFRILGGVGNLMVEIDNPNYDEDKCNEATFNCQYNTWHPNHEGFCLDIEVYCNGTGWIVRTEPTDLLFTRTEQTLATQAYIVEELDANHFQEQEFDRNRAQYLVVYDNTNPNLKLPK